MNAYQIVSNGTQLLGHATRKYDAGLCVYDDLSPFSHAQNLAQRTAELRPEVVLARRIDDRTESIGRKIRDNELKKIPYMLIVGQKEAEAGTVGVRKQGEGDLGAKSVGEFVEWFKGLL